MNSIRQACIEEIIWDKHWEHFTKWGLVKGKWRKETVMLEKTQIRSYMSTPQVAKFDGLKEGVVKFIIRLYHHS
jgi:hypothetical protein